MNTIELNHFISNIKEKNSFDEAHLGFYYEDENEIYSGHIKANKQGLMLYGIELIEASLKTENETLNKSEFHTFSNNWDSINSDISIGYIEISQKLRSEIEPITANKETWEDRLLKIFFLGIFIFILISILVGAYTILSWTF